MPEVKYKLKAEASYATLEFEGPSVLASALRHAVVSRKLNGNAGAMGLTLTNAITGQGTPPELHAAAALDDGCPRSAEYVEDDALVPADAMILVKRVPLSRMSGAPPAPAKCAQGSPSCQMCGSCCPHPRMIARSSTTTAPADASSSYSLSNAYSMSSNVRLLCQLSLTEDVLSAHSIPCDGCLPLVVSSIPGWLLRYLFPPPLYVSCLPFPSPIESSPPSTLCNPTYMSFICSCPIRLTSAYPLRSYVCPFHLLSTVRSPLCLLSSIQCTPLSNSLIRYTWLSCPSLRVQASSVDKSWSGASTSLSAPASANQCSTDTVTRPPAPNRHCNHTAPWLATSRSSCSPSSSFVLPFLDFLLPLPLHFVRFRVLSIHARCSSVEFGLHLQFGDPRLQGDPRLRGAAAPGTAGQGAISEGGGEAGQDTASGAGFVIADEDEAAKVH